MSNTGRSASGLRVLEDMDWAQGGGILEFSGADSLR